MDAKEVIVAQAVANAELMAERDALRNQLITTMQENEALRAQLPQDGEVKDEG